MTRRLLLATVALCALAALGQTARADTVTITSGFASGISVGVDNGWLLNFAGDNFSVQATGESYQFVNNVFLPPNTTLSPSATFFLNVINPGSATFNGASFTQIRFVNSTLLVAPVTFTTPPPGDVRITTVDAPFTMTGTLNAVDFQTGAPVFSVDVMGSGIATITFGSGPAGSIIQRVIYNFAPPASVPEPTALLLLGAGLGGLALKRRRSRSRP